MSGRMGIMVLGLVLTAVGSALAQTSPVEVKTSTPADPRELEIVTPAPGSRDVTRPREADFYPNDVRVPYDPGFVEPLTTRPKSGPIKRVGVSGWTAPAGRGDGYAAGQELNGWFGFGISVIWE